MGNSVKAWEQFYDKYAESKHSAEGVQLMQQWRAQMLKQERATIQVPHSLSADIDVDLSSSDTD